MQHFFELLRPRPSLSTVPSFHDTFFLARRFRRSTTASGAGAGADAAAGGGAEVEDDASIVTVTDPVEEDCGCARVAIGMENLGSSSSSSSSSSVAGATRRWARAQRDCGKATSSGQIGGEWGTAECVTERKAVWKLGRSDGIYGGLSGFFFIILPAKAQEACRGLLYYCLWVLAAKVRM